MPIQQKATFQIWSNLAQLLNTTKSMKSVKDENKAIELLHDVISISTSGSFRSTKIISDSVEVLQSIPESKEGME